MQTTLLPPIASVPYRTGELAFEVTKAECGRYLDGGRKILQRGLMVPTGDYTASILHGAYFSEKTDNILDFADIKWIMADGGFWIYNKTIWTTQGVYVMQDTEVLAKNVKIKIGDLEESLKGGKKIGGVWFSQDERVRFAPKGTYGFDKHTPESFSTDGFVIASFGLDGAEKMGAVAHKFKETPETSGLVIRDGGRPIVRVSAIHNFNRDRLFFAGAAEQNNPWNGYAFGVFPNKTA